MDYQKRLDELNERISTLKPHHKFNAENFIATQKIQLDLAQSLIGQLKVAKEPQLIEQLDEMISIVLNSAEKDISAEENYGAS